MPPISVHDQANNYLLTLFIQENCSDAEIGHSRYNAMDSPSVAAKVADHIRNAVADQPGKGKPGRIHGTRERMLVDVPCIIAYRMGGNNVVILRVLHTSRKWPETIT